MTANDRILEGQMLDESMWLGFPEFCTRLRVERHWVVELVDVGLLEPRGAAPDSWVFPASALARARAAARLADDLGVNAAGAAVILDLLEERRHLQRRLRGLEQASGERFGD